EPLQPVTLPERLARTFGAFGKHRHEMVMLEQAHRVVGRGDDRADSAHEGAYPWQAECPVEHHEPRLPWRRALLEKRDVHHRRIPGQYAGMVAASIARPLPRTFLTAVRLAGPQPLVLESEDG